MAALHNVYDLVNASPPPLKLLARNAVVLDLWRCEIKHHLKSDGTFRVPDLKRKTALECLSSHVPLTVYWLIQRFVYYFPRNVGFWLTYHAPILPPKFSIFNHFTDFYLHLDGDIDYAQTAKRLLLCNQVKDYHKFWMACLYCLEEDIFTLWPKVWRHFSKSELSLDETPVMFYWIHRLGNRLSEIVLSEGTSSVEEVILEAVYNNFNLHQWPAIEYFLNRLGPDARLRFMLKMSEKTEDKDHEQIFCRYMLPKLDEETVRTLVATRGDELVFNTYSWYTMFVWEYIKDKITPDGFCRLVKCMLRDQTESFSNSWCEIWPSAPIHLKKSAIPRVLEDSRSFDREDQSFTSFYGTGSVGDRREVSFLKIILLETPLELRNKFWNNNWHILINDIKINDLRDLINLCFDGDQTQIIRFKKDALTSDFETIYETSSYLLKEAAVEDLEDFLQFWYLDDESALRDVRLKLLNENFNSVMLSELLEKAHLLNEFIDKAHLDEDLAIKFKNQMLLPPETKVINAIVTCLQFGRFRGVMEFIDTFTQSEALATQFKEEHIIPEVVSLLHSNYRYCHFLRNRFRCDEFENFMNWLLRSDDRMTRFKETLNIDVIVLRAIEHETEQMANRGYKYYQDNRWFRECFHASQLRETPLKTFLKWYFVSSENLEEFLNKYADNEAFVQLMSKLI